MMLNLNELTDEVRASAVAELDAELGGLAPFYPARLNETGRDMWPDMMRAALKDHDVEWLVEALLADDTLVGFEGSVNGLRPVNARAAAELIGLSEFNTWYVRGLSAQLLREGVPEVRVYRAGRPKFVAAACAQHEGRVYPTRQVFDGHRARYHPVRRDVFSIPFHPNCHHSIERVVSMTSTAVSAVGSNPEEQE
jgi:hypothetical protein